MCCFVVAVVFLVKRIPEYMMFASLNIFGQFFCVYFEFLFVEDKLMGPLMPDITKCSTLCKGFGQIPIVALFNVLHQL